MANSTNWRSISYGKRGCSNVMVVEPQDAGKKNVLAMRDLNLPSQITSKKKILVGGFNPSEKY